MSEDHNLIHCLDFEEFPDVTANASQLWEGILQPLEGDALALQCCEIPKLLYPKP